MPTYEYKCEKCGYSLEVRHRINDYYSQKCPHCGGNLEKVIGPGAGFFLKSKKTTMQRKNSCCDLNFPCCG